MTYSDFSFAGALSAFGLSATTANVFPPLTPAASTAWLQETLEKTRWFAFASKKARSEFIVAPLLLTVRELTGNRIAIFSGERFDVDSDTGLAGECGFLLSADVPVPIIRAPIFTLVEAKKADIQLGLGQCVAQMVGAQRFNEQAGEHNLVYGCVTAGELWQFLRLSGSDLILDSDRFRYPDMSLILSAFLFAINAAAPPQSTH